MQKTRQKILDYLRQQGEATVEELSRALDDLTPVTVRHHLDVLRSEDLVAAPEVRHRATPGRPRYVYTLTERARESFPKNLGTLTGHMISHLKETMPPAQINVFFEGLAARMATDMEPGPVNEPLERRLERAVAHLSEHGYEARWEPHPRGYVLHTRNCPYTGIASDHQDLCLLDIRYISHLLGAVPRRLDFIPEGADSCSYLIETGS